MVSCRESFSATLLSSECRNSRGLFRAINLLFLVLVIEAIMALFCAR